MAKNQNTFAKRQREMEKKRKSEDKRTRRQKRKDEPAAATPPDHGDLSSDQDASEEPSGNA